MKLTVSTTQRLTLLAAAGLLCLGATGATAQRGGRGGGRAATSNAASGTASGTGSCPANSTSTSGTTTSTSATGTTTSSGVTSSLSALASRGVFGLSNSQRAAIGSSASTAAANAFSVQRTSANQVAVSWSGSTANAQTVYLGLLDANGKVLAQQTITQAPVQANLTLSNTARYVGVKVVYQNGASATSYAPLR